MGGIAAAEVTLFTVGEQDDCTCAMGDIWISVSGPGVSGEFLSDIQGNSVADVNGGELGSKQDAIGDAACS